MPRLRLRAQKTTKIAMQDRQNPTYGHKNSIISVGYYRNRHRKNNGIGNGYQWNLREPRGMKNNATALPLARLIQRRAPPEIAHYGCLNPIREHGI